MNLLTFVYSPRRKQALLVFHPSFAATPSIFTVSRTPDLPDVWRQVLYIFASFPSHILSSSCSKLTFFSLLAGPHSLFITLHFICRPDFFNTTKCSLLRSWPLAFLWLPHLHRLMV